MLLKRFYDLEHEYRQISARIAESSRVSERIVLRRYRKEIVAEARAIINELNKPEPNWCDEK
jgi:hypothetical protein